MDDAMTVGVAQRLGDVAGDVERVFQGELRFPQQPLPQRFTFHVRHDVVQ